MSQTTSDAALRERYTTPLPPAVKRRQEEAARIMREMRGEAPEGAPSAPAGGQEAAEQGQGTPTPSGAEGVGVQPTQAGAPQAEPSAPANEPKSETRSDSGGDVESLKRALEEARQEARTWKGRHSKTAEEQRALATRLESLEAALEEAKKATPPEPEMKGVSDDEVEAYGQDLLDVAKRYVLPAARAEFEKALRPLVERLDALESGVKGVQAKEAKSDWDRFLERLDKKIPGWRETDTTEAFGAWLDSPDPLFDEPRRMALDSAIAKLDDERVIKVFKAYSEQTGGASGGSRSAKATASSKAGTEAPRVEPTAQPEEDERPTLEALAAPGRPASSQPGPMPVRPGAKVWTEAEITAYYRGRANGTHPHSHPDKRAEALAMDTEIAAAQREGRVVG